MTTLDFKEMNLSPDTLKAIADLGYEEATPIQSQVIDLLLSGRDIVGQSQTVTGKTAAFGIPCLERIDPENRKLQALILCPTRELAIQISEEFRKLLKYRDNIKVLPVYGGQPIDRQILALKKGVQVVIGTPGRVMDHMERRTLKLETVNTVVLDEADEMLDMGFRDDIEFILNKTAETRQTVMFSATMPREILDLAKIYQTNPEVIRVAHKELTVPSIDQFYFEVRESTKLEALCRLIDMYDPELSLVFCNTKKRVDELVEALQGRGYFAEGLHGDLKQVQRDIVMKKFRNKTLEILVATDVAARGIDVDNISIVFNYDLPSDEEYYVHRIGRTGRAGKKGVAYTFVVGREIYKLRDIMHYTKSKILYEKLPTLNDIEEIRLRNFIDKIKATIDEGKLARYVNAVESITEGVSDYSTLDIAAALLKLHLFDETSEDIDFEPAHIEKKRSFDSQPQPRRSDENMVRLFINVGRKDKVQAKDLVGMIAGESGISGKQIGAIDIYEDFSFVDIPKGLVKTVTDGIKNKKLKGKKVSVDKAKKK